MNSYLINHDSFFFLEEEIKYLKWKKNILKYIFSHSTVCLEGTHITIPEKDHFYRELYLKKPDFRNAILELKKHLKNINNL
jgi:hypothetical protein